MNWYMIILIGTLMIVYGAVMWILPLHLEIGVGYILKVHAVITGVAVLLFFMRWLAVKADEKRQGGQN